MWLTSDDLIPLQDRLEIKKRFKKLDPLEERFIYVEVKGASWFYVLKENPSIRMHHQLVGIY